MSNLSEKELAKIGAEFLAKQELQKVKDKWYLAKANHVKKEMERVIRENNLQGEIQPFNEPFPTA